MLWPSRRDREGKTEFNKKFEGFTKNVETKVNETVNTKIEEKMSKFSKDVNDRNKELQDKVNSVSDDIKRLEERTIPRINETLGDVIDSLRRNVDRVGSALKKTQKAKTTNALQRQISSLEISE